ncbi:MAG: glycosyltransferase family 4 protein [Leptospiraceae bacterium]|nr:glycosyltransferase family 4 protein [Leptospiraceae bacterium]
MKLHQFSAGFNPGDAISNQMIIIQDRLRQFGYNGSIFSENINVEKKSVAKKFKSYSPNYNDIILYHHSIHSQILDFLLEVPRKIKKIFIYHNVTPSEFYLPYDLRLAELLKQGREELKGLRRSFDHFLAVSDFNRKELISLGIDSVGILPLILSLNLEEKIHFEKESNPKKILFVGRIAPNKKQDDLIKIASILNRFYSIPFKLQLVGNTSRESMLYRSELNNLVKFLELESVVEFLEFQNEENLRRCYREASLFLCMSEHEGFCVPLMEAMHYDLPILAYNGGAVKETLGGAGILFLEKKLDLIAESINRVLTDSELSNTIVQSQRKRLQSFQEQDPIQILLQYLGK